jgi:hypothetical protein
MRVQKVNKKSIRILILFLLVASVMHSQTRPRESLRGLSGVYVYVHPVEKDVEAGGLSTNQIQKVVETQLRTAGIPLQSEPQTANGSANLVVIINTVKHPQGAYIYDVEVSLLQEVHLTRLQDPEPFPSQTWGAKALGLTSANRMDLILEPLKARLADFVADYLAVNAKAASVKGDN